MEQNKKLKLLWSSNASFTPTGYGQVTNQVAYGLFENGIDIRVACNYGLAGASLGLNGLIHYPNLFAEIGEDALKIIIDSWKPDVFVTLYDVWVGAKAKHAGIECLFKSLHDRWIAYVPVDHLPIPDAVADQSRRAYKVVAMSQFGQEQFKSVGIPSTYIPHGADTKIYKPSDKQVAKEWLQKHSTPYSEKKPAVYDKDSFIVGINAANKDPMRKDFGRMFTAFQIFLDQNPDAKKDARMHVHTWSQFPGGFNLPHLAQKLGIDSYIRAPFQYDMLCSLPIERMADVYNSMDVFMNLTRGEGFGVPIIEAQACFPFDTRVVVDSDINCAHERVYNGEIYSIETERGFKVTATAEHPFLTNTCWKRAKHLKIGDMLTYNGNTYETKGLDSRRIKEITDAIQTKNTSTNKQGNGENLRFDILEGKTTGLNQTISRQHQNERICFNRSPVSLSRWHDRWRRNDNNQEEQQETQSHDNNSQYRQRNAGNFEGLVKQFKHLLSAPFFYGRLGSAYRWTGTSRVLQNASALPSYKAQTMSHRYGVDNSTLTSEQLQQTLGKRSGIIHRYPLAQPETITKINVSNARNLKVYNLTTKNHLYFANGFLVHNCGVPAIVTDFTSMTELVKGHGWLVPSFAERITCPNCKSELSYNGGAKMFSHMMSLYSLPDEYKCADAIEDAYNHPEKTKKFGEQSREFALDYDYKTKIIPQWLDLLGEVKSELGMLGKWSGKDEGYDDMFKEAMK